jgi:uncharacterized protein with GYD domain
MATYILLMTLTPEGQFRALEDPNYLLHVESEIDMPSVQTLGVYAVLGQYDFVTLVEADSNDAMARFSLKLGVEAGVHITTLPVVPTAQLAELGGWPLSGEEAVGELPDRGELPERSSN